VASGGREPAQHDPRGRLEAAPRGSSAAGRAGTTRPGLHCKNLRALAPGTPLFREPVSVSMVLRVAPDGAEVWMRGRGSKGLKSLCFGPLWVSFGFKVRNRLQVTLAPAPLNTPKGAVVGVGLDVASVDVLCMGGA